MIKSKKHLKSILGHPFNELKELTTKIDEYYYEKKEEKRNDDGTLKIVNGKIQYRELTPSKGKLKLIQSRIKNKILCKIDFPLHVQGGVKKRDNIKNAKFHLGKKYHFTTDFKDFFPSITCKMVYEMFLENGFSYHIASVLTKLTTYKGKLPQGTPTSTYIANLVALPLDKQLLEFDFPSSITYTRYVDDLTFSCSNDFQFLTKNIIDIIKKNGFIISHRKTAYKLGPIEITGIETRNNVLKVKQKIMQKINNPDIPLSSINGLIAYKNRVNNQNY